MQIDKDPGNPRSLKQSPPIQPKAEIHTFASEKQYKGLTGRSARLMKRIETNTMPYIPGDPFTQ